MNLLKIGLLAAGAWLLLPRLGVSLPNPFGTSETPPAAPPADPTQQPAAPVAQIAAHAIFAAKVRDRAAAAGKTTANWWEWTWFYHNILNGNSAEVIPASEQFGVVSPAALLTFDEFWRILQDGKARGVADLPGLAGLWRR